MSVSLKVEQEVDGVDILIARINQDSILIGREPKPFGIVLPSLSVSGTHGEFIRFDHYWLYRDLGSTNGSTFNEKRLNPGAYHLIKNNEYLTISNTPLKLSLEFSEHEVDEAGIEETPTVLVFWEKIYIGDLPFPSNGMEYMLGGDDSALKLTKTFNDNHLIQVSKEANKVHVRLIKNNTPSFVNGEIFESDYVCVDRDEIVVGDLSFVYNSGFDSALISKAVTNTGTFVATGNLDLEGKMENQSRLNSSFGQIQEDEDPDDRFASLSLERKTEAIRYSGTTKQSGISFEDKIILAVGVVLFLVLFILLIIFVLS